MGDHKSQKSGVDDVSGHGSRRADRTDEPRWAEGRRMDRALGTERQRQAWERLVASCRREAKRAVG
jgi:hypothetical protein